MQRESPVPDLSADFSRALASPDDYPQVSWPAMARTAGRFPRSAYYDHLARLATHGQCDAEALLAAARAGATVDQVDSRGVGWFAHVTASHVENPTRYDDVVALLALAGTTGRTRAFAPQLDDVWLQSFFLGGHLEQKRGMLKKAAPKDVTKWTVETDSAHPGEVTADATAWFELFTRPFAKAGLEPVTVRGGAGEPFDRLVCHVPPLPDEDLPLVTVVIPVYNPGASLRTAVASLLAQSWWNLDIVLADDASTAGEEVFQEVLALDPRVRRVRAPRNAGAYSARNLGLGAGRGELVTFNDADDWAHPRKIERQARSLLGTPGAKGSISWALRCTEDLRLTVIGRPTHRINLSSIMVRRDEVLADLGGFDAVRKGGDTEFVERLLTVYGSNSIVETRAPLSLVQLTSGSLSRDDYRFLRTHPARRQYVFGFRRWHQTLESGFESPFIPTGVRGPYPAPGALSGRENPTVVHDVLVVTNLSPASPTVVDLAAELAALADAGIDVAVREQLAPFDLTTSVRPPAGEYAKLIVQGKVTQVTTFEPAHASLLVVRDPASVATAPVGDPPDVVGRTLVVADYSPAGGARYAPAEVESRLQTVSPDVRWLPATRSIHDELVAAGCSHVLEPATYAALPGPVSPPRTSAPRERVAVFPGDLHRSGRQDLERTVRLLAPSPGLADTFVVGPRRFGSLAPTVTEDEATVEQVAAVTDVVVVGATPGRGGHTHRAALRALHVGCVVIADPELRSHLGEAALYLDEGTTSEWFARLVESPELLERQRAFGAEHARRHTSPHLLAALVTGVLDDRSEGSHQ